MSGIIEGFVAGAAGFGARQVERSLIETAQAERDERLAEIAKNAQTHGAKLAQETHAANVETDIAALPRRGAAETEVLRGRQEALLPGKVDEATKLGAVAVQTEVDKFTKLAPLQRKEAIDGALAQLKALSSPEALAQSRAIALSKHIVDPNYLMVPNADGTVTMVNSRDPSSATILTGPDKKPVIRKDPEETKAAVAVINMANTNLRIAQAEHKAAIADVAADEQSKAAANAAWQSALEESKRLTMPAYAVLYGKAKISGEPGAKKEDRVADPRTAKLDYGFVNEKTGYKWIGRPGDKLDDPKNWQAPKSGSKRGIVEGAIRSPGEE